MTISISIPWILVIAGVVLFIFPIIYAASRPSAGDYGLDVVPLLVGAACWPVGIISIIVGIVLLA